MASTVIDSLVVELGIDDRKFRQSERETLSSLERSRRSLKEMGDTVESTTVKLNNVFGVIKGGLAGMVGVVAGSAIGEFIAKVAQMDANTGRLAHSLGISTRNMSVWQGVVKQAGGSAEEANATLATLSDTLSGIQAGTGMPSGPFAYLLNRIGLGPNAEPEDVLQRAMDFVERAQQQGMPARQARFLLNQIPGMTPGMLNAMMQGRKAFEDMARSASELAPLEEERAKQAQAMQKDFALLDLALIGLARETFPLLIAAINGATSAFRSWKNGPHALLGDIIKPDLTPDALLKYGRGLSRGDVNNNPGNIKFTDFAKRHGATGADDKGFAIFPNQGAGVEAMANLLNQHYQGLSLSGIADKWAPDHPPSYVDAMSAATGLKPSDVPNLNDPLIVTKLIEGMMRGEGTHLRALPAPRATPGAGAGAGSTSSVSINTINVSSPNADPAKVAQAIPDAIRRMVTIAPSINALA